ncbi:MAG: YicC family protein [Clostridia bacterium]|nr:YicC family protein [Clostridia bacterium]
MRSMTGYGKCQLQRDSWEVTVELRAVNHRYLDVAMRLPRNLLFLEDGVRKGLQKLVRGHVDVYITVRQLDGASRVVEADTALAVSYAKAAQAIRSAVLEQTREDVQYDLTVSRLMRLEGVTTLTEAAMDEEAVAALCQEALAGAIAQLDDMRLREGENLRADLAEHLAQVAALREKVIAYAPKVVEEYRARLTEKLARLPIEPVDPARLAQEVALMADKCAIDEELSRLDSHIAQLRRYLDAQGETGKKMDFLIQEMNRETNTIGSKCSDAAIAQCVVDMKSEIEKLREQIQNAV